MKLSFDDLKWVTGQGIISMEQAEAIWAACEQRKVVGGKFDLAHLAYYAGALTVILAMAWYLAISWEPYGAVGIILIATAYAIFFAFAGRHLWQKQKLTVPGGLLITLSVCMVPLIVYGIERLTGFWPQGDPGIYTDFHRLVRSSWLGMELATVGASLLALRFFKFPFLTAPLSFSLWYMAMDVTPLLFRKQEFSSNEYGVTAMVLGALMMGVARLIDMKRITKEDFGFWLHLFGLMSLMAGSLAVSWSDTDNTSQFMVGLLWLGIMLAALPMKRKAYTVFGAAGLYRYIMFACCASYKLLPLLFGITTLVVAYLLDLKHHKKYAFWVYLFGLIPFWFALAPWASGSELAFFIVALVNCALMLVSVLLQRRAFLVFGALGIIVYLSHLAWEVFKGEPIFPIALATLGLFTIWLGIHFQRHGQAIRNTILSHLPNSVSAYLPPRND